MTMIGRAAALMACLWLGGAHAISVDGFDKERTRNGSTVLVPEDAEGKPAVLILLPFTGGSAQDLFERRYARSLPKQAQREGIIIVLPSATGSASDYSTGSAWGATLDRYTRNIAADAQEVIERFNGDPKRVMVGGFSMGGDLSWALIQRDPERYAGAIVMGSRASYRDAKGLKRFGERGGRVYFYIDRGESQARIDGTRAAIGTLRKAGIGYRHTAGGQGGHVGGSPEDMSDAIEFLLRGDGSTPSATSDAAGGKPVPRAATSREIVDRLPGCDWEPLEDDSSGKYGYQDARGKVVVKPRFEFAEYFRNDGLAGVVENGNWSYINCEGKTFQVISIDNGPDLFSEGLARFREGNRYGYLNRRGEVVIPAQFDSAEAFCKGVASTGSDCSAVRSGDYTALSCVKWAYIDKAGRTVTPKEPPRPGECD